MEDKPFQPLLVNFVQAAELLSVSLRTVQRLVVRGELEVVRPTADAPRIRYADLVARTERPTS